MVSKLSELQQIRNALELNQADMGKLLGVGQSGYQRWEASPNSAAAREATEKAKEIYRKKKGKPWIAIGGQPVELLTAREETGDYDRVTGALPRHVEQAFKLLMEVADLHQADVKDFDRSQFGRVLGIAAREIARSGDGEEVRREVIHEAEILLGLMK